MKLLTALLASLCLFAVASSAQVPPPSATLTWTAVTQYSDGTPIPASVTVTYNIYQGLTAASLAKVATGVTALTSSISVGLTDGTSYFWAVTAVAGGLEGSQSNVGTKTFAAIAPGTVTLTVK